MELMPNQNERNVDITRPYIRTVVNSILKLIHLKENWSPYGGVPISQEVVSIALGMIDTVLITQRFPAPPNLVPLTSGGIQIEWETEDTYLEVTIENKDNVSWFIKSSKLDVGFECEAPNNLNLLYVILRGL